MAQSLSYHPNNDQPILLSHRYPSSVTKIDYPSYQLDRSPLPPLSRLLTDDNNSPDTPTTTTTSDLYYSTQPPSTILASTDSPLASVDLFNTPATTITTPSSTTTTATETMMDPSSCMLTTTPQTMPDSLSTMYMNDPPSTMMATEALMYGPTMLPTTTTTTSSSSSPSTTLSSPSSSLLSTTTMNPLLSTANTMIQPPYLYSSGPTPYDDPIRCRQDSISSNTSDKVYSFVAIPGMNQRKRPRRRYDEIERLYHCTFPGCKKSYGTLNHLNSHVLMQSHGPKRHPAEFKEMRKEWRRIRKQRETQKKEAEQVNKQQQEHHQQLLQQQHHLRSQQQQPILTDPFQPSFMPSDSTNYSLQPMLMPGSY
ncbi:hypothetical protein BC941DRAFT_425563 [Chlamydoabsidia padenii]|nr:hypothetical protein BC941DRAFT_425563 [Chlamydoabsidia padenii]